MEAIPRLAEPPEARKTRSAVISTNDWATWTARVPANARHHSLASPSVWGRAWQTRQIGAATTRRMTRARRTT